MIDIPVLLQSSNAEAAERARMVGALFLRKGSPTLLHDLGQFVKKNFGFGDFIFRMPDVTEVGRASNLKELEDQLHIVPDECVNNHSEHNHFSNWLKARTEFWLAHKLRPQKVTDFPTIEGLRKDIIDTLRSYKEERQRGVMTEFSKDSFDPQTSFARIGTGSIGGKARGLGFINALITNFSLRKKIRRSRGHRSVGCGDCNGCVRPFFAGKRTGRYCCRRIDRRSIDAAIRRCFFVPESMLSKNCAILSGSSTTLWPVRSSSLLEDSQYQPFAGVYQTYMIPNNNADPDIRLKELLESIKLV